jgi:hypothetical protein
MKFSFAGRMAMAVALACYAISFCAAQQSQKPEQNSTGKVIFSRSIDENGEVQTNDKQRSAEPAVQFVSESSAQDAERKAVTFTDFDLDIRLVEEAGQLAAHARVTVRNDGKTALEHIPLQISSSLNWERIRLNGTDMPIKVATLNSDADHTGQLHEAEVTLVQPLAPGATLVFDLNYSGKIVATAQRLLAVGAPEDVALHSDWDRIGVDFTGLRGFGNVVWYPVSSVPVILGDGARIFEEIGEHKLRLTGAHFKMRLTVEFPHGQGPTVAFINGHPVHLAVTESGMLDQSQEVSGVATASLDDTELGFEAPNLFVAIRRTYADKNFTAWVRDENANAASAWSAAAEKVVPFLAKWLGDKPGQQLTILDLPDSQDASFESGTLLVTPVGEGTPDKLEDALAHSLTHAWIQSPLAWLNEGAATFMGTLWIEKQSGRTKALESLEAGRTALTLVEPESPGQSAGQPLVLAISPVYYRTKAAYVFWMLRDAVGDDVLAAAFRSYNSNAVQSAAGNQNSFRKTVEAAGVQHNLSWLFSDWVDADKGLPDLSIESVYPKHVTGDSWLVAVNVVNDGYASAEVPVTVRSAGSTATQRLFVMARGKAVQRILIQGKPIEAQVNDGTVPETGASVHVTKLTTE